MEEKLYQYLLMLGDNTMILGHRLSELCGHGPTLETDIALTNIALDLFGQTRNYFQYAAQVNAEEDVTEDDIAFLRYPHQYRNALLVEQPNTDFAYVIVRQFLFDAFHLPLLEDLTSSKDAQIAAIATKSSKEVKYHYRFSSGWIRRLLGGTKESYQRTTAAFQDLWPYCNELLVETPIERTMREKRVGASLDQIRDKFFAAVRKPLEENSRSKLNEQVDLDYDFKGADDQRLGKAGLHSEHHGYILAELQYMQRTCPQMQR